VMPDAVEVSLRPIAFMSLSFLPHETISPSYV